MLNSLIAVSLASSLLAIPFSGPAITVETETVAGQETRLVFQEPKVLASENLDLSYRYPVENISMGFRENILVNLYYLGKISSVETDLASTVGGDGKKIEPDEDYPRLFSFRLNPGEVFAFQDAVLPEYSELKIVTQKSHYKPSEGYNSTAGLYGNGVCHLATLMNWVASEAGLEVKAPTRHDFAKIPGIDPEYGTSISMRSAELQNLYIENNQLFPVEFRFMVFGEILNFSITSLGEYLI